MATGNYFLTKQRPYKLGKTWLCVQNICFKCYVITIKTNKINFRQNGLPYSRDPVPRRSMSAGGCI